MKFLYVTGLILAVGLGSPLVMAGVLTSARVVEIRNDVRYQPVDAAERAAQVTDLVRETDVLRTGERSLAELEFNDKTITRLGSMTVFSFNRETREFRAGKGTMLICVPKGMGGGRIVTSAITAAIQGTTVVTQEIEVPGTGGGKPRTMSQVIFLEGNGTVYRTGDPSHSGAPIGAGQMIAQFTDGRGLGHVQNVDLAALTSHSRIVHGFSTQLPSLPIIQQVVNQQQTDLQQGNLQHTTTGQQGTGTGTTPGQQGTGTTPDQQGTGTTPDQQLPQLPPQPTPQQPIPPQPYAGLVIYNVGAGFYLSNLPIPGYNSAPLEGGGYICRKPR